jgi:hypothetical protein
MPTIATRPKQAAAPLGTGQLHQALEESQDRSKLKAFCAAVGCTAAEASSDGAHLDILRVLDVMRVRGYQVSAPIKPPHQPRRDLTTWLVDVILPNNGPALRLGFVTPNAS